MLFMMVSFLFLHFFPRTQYDIEKGLLLKLDSFLQIQLGTVFRGLTRVPDEEVISLYRNRFIPIQYVEGVKGNVSWTVNHT
jgi:5' nucleotidase family